MSINGQSITRGFTLGLVGYANANSGFAQAGAMTSTFDGEFSQTVTWGGGTRVSVLETGEVLSNYTITSESGFDYSKPFPVPEPAGLLPLAPTIGLLALRHRAAGRARHLT